jgi:hypothetical protein
VEIRKQFKAKYGKKFEEAALNNEGGILNERVVTKLSVQPPAAGLVQTYLEKICAKYEVDWSPSIRLSTEEMGAVRSHWLVLYPTFCIELVVSFSFLVPR